ncbi:T9SS type A sorting domain-containing protein [Spirosoma oryzicola]|uniref:T9SS type A sorting domain-containing protein n=1 Tax=Spirosoma oryzicola TaxID=2898794 RepID=UPI001E630B91|nr:T9SS type A sorting domain-containing protein [Spirosoma oryzicola]UHG89814.1 T9SS type A sorting domain-containing protein [Spirosoma oryzicola]
MKKEATLVLLASILVTFTQNAFAQTISLIKNPDNGQGYLDIYYPRTEYPLIVYRNALYGKYTNANGRGQLVKYDGTKMELIPEPDNEVSGKGGVFGEMIVYNNILYCIYNRYFADGRYSNYLAKFDGTTLKVLDNPDQGVGFFQTASLTVFNNALYGRYIDIDAKYRLVKIDDSVSNQPFSITGVVNVDCEVIATNQRKLTFTPRYTGLTGQPVSFSVSNELLPTTQPGPYSLNLYTDNPVVTLKATQEGTAGEQSYILNWLPYCKGARLSAKSASTDLSIQVMPNPSSDQVIKILVDGALGEQVTIQVTDQQGKLVSYTRIEEVAATMYSSAQLGYLPGVYLLKVSTPTQNKTIKIMKQ